MKEAERVARIYKEFFTTFVLLLSQLIGWQLRVDEDTLREFRILGEKVNRINKRYTKGGNGEIK